MAKAKKHEGQKTEPLPEKEVAETSLSSELTTGSENGPPEAGTSSSSEASGNKAEADQGISCEESKLIGAENDVGDFGNPDQDGDDEFAEPLIDINEPRAFEKLRLEVQAIQSTGSPENNQAIIDWTKGSQTPASMGDHPDRGKCLTIATLEGAHWVDVEDYVICGIAGEFYPCKPDIFEASYVPVGSANALGELSGPLPDFEPVTEDMSLWAGFRSQRAVARVGLNLEAGFEFDDDFVQPPYCLTFEQCVKLAYLLRKSPDCSVLVMRKHLELLEVPLFEGIPDPVLEAYRGSFNAVEGYLRSRAAREASKIKRTARKVPVSETTLETTDEPFTLSQTAQGR